MPWTIKDVDRHKKGLTPAQKKKWVSVANGILKQCKASGGSGCEGKAIRIANSKFEEKVMGDIRSEEIPRGALCLVDEGNEAHAYTELGEDGKKKLNMVAYSGKVIKGHWYWGDLAIDCSGVKLDKKVFPILESHDVDRKIAFSASPTINNDGIRINPDKSQFVSTPASEEFQKVSSEGFPFQSSISAKPTVIERMEDGESAEVNGYKFKGPGTIWRKSILREASVCVFGWDNQTSATALSKEPEAIELQYISHNEDNPKIGEEVKKVMDINELKKEHPDLVKQVEDGVRMVVEAEFAKKETKFNTELGTLRDANVKLSETVQDLDKRDTIRSEAELKAKADTVWAEKLAQSNIPERLYSKVSLHVSHNKFVEKGVLDPVKFSEAVDTEIKDWESKGAVSEVLGSTFLSKEEETTKTKKEQDQEKEDDKMTKDLLANVGQKEKETQT